MGPFVVKFYGTDYAYDNNADSHCGSPGARTPTPKPPLRAQTQDFGLCESCQYVCIALANLMRLD
jgi:hypothetical protein